MIELIIVQFINHLGMGTWLDQVTIYYSNNFLLIAAAVISLVIIAIIDKENRQSIILASVIALFLHFVFTVLLLKNILPQLGLFRLRPYLESAQIIPLGLKNIDTSFPSSHVASLTAFLLPIAYYYRKLLVPIIILIVFMMFTRIHVGMHYLSDTIFGVFFGSIYAWLGLIAARKVKIKK